MAGKFTNRTLRKYKAPGISVKNPELIKLPFLNSDFNTEAAHIVQHQVLADKDGNEKEVITVKFTVVERRKSEWEM